jgi:hypothetical protein
MCSCRRREASDYVCSHCDVKFISSKPVTDIPTQSIAWNSVVAEHNFSVGLTLSVNDDRQLLKATRHVYTQHVVQHDAWS